MAVVYNACASIQQFVCERAQIIIIVLYAVSMLIFFGKKKWMNALSEQGNVVFLVNI